MNASEEKRLFSKRPVQFVLQQRAQAMIERIDRLTDDILLGTDPEDLSAEQAGEERIAMPIIKDGEKTMDAVASDVRFASSVRPRDAAPAGGWAREILVATLVQKLIRLGLIVWRARRDADPALGFYSGESANETGGSA